MLDCSILISNTHEQFAEYQTVFESFRIPIQRYDFFRYLAICHFGGFYLDLDVLLASSLSDLLEFGCVFPFEELTISTFLRRKYGMDWESGNYAFGASARHPFIDRQELVCALLLLIPVWTAPRVSSQRDRPFIIGMYYFGGRSNRVSLTLYRAY